MHLDWDVQDWEGQRFIYLENWTIGENHRVSNSRKRPEQLVTSLLFWEANFACEALNYIETRWNKYMYMMYKTSLIKSNLSNMSVWFMYVG